MHVVEQVVDFEGELRVHDSFELFSCIPVAKDELAHLRTVERAVGRRHTASERPDDFGHGFAACSGERAGDLIGIHDGITHVGQKRCGSAFA